MMVFILFMKTFFPECCSKGAQVTRPRNIHDNPRMHGVRISKNKR